MVPLSLVLLACAPPAAEAPATMDELSVTLLREFEGEAPEETAQGLADWLLDHADEQDGFTLADVTAEDVADMPYDGGEDGDPDLTLQRGIAVTHRVVGTIAEHAAIVPEADQSFADPTYEIWDRSLAEGDEQGFLGGADMRTDNAIEKSGAFGVTIGYDLGKDYRWLTLDIGGAPTDTLMFRSYELAPGWSDDHKNGLVYGWTIELWVPDPDGELIWYNASWCLLVTAVDGVFDEDFIIQSIIDGTLDYMDGTGAHATGADGS